MLERDFKKNFQRRLKRAIKPTAILQYKQDATTVSGFPDTIILGPEAVVVFIEYKKSKTAKFRPGQKEWGEKLLANNFFYYCVYPENADAVLAELVEIMK
jgi:hypothetical protein